MKLFKLPLIIGLLLSTQILSQNVGINATGAAPDASAMLDIVSANRGLLIPRVALTATNAAGPIAAPTTSLLVYNTATAGAGLTAVTPGYYYWDGAAWVRFLASNTIDDWKLLGNAGTTAGTNFVGTTDAQHLDFRTNNTQRVRIMNSTHPTVGVGTAFPVTNLSGTTAVLHVHDGGGSVGSQLILSNSSTTSGDRAGLINFSATQVTNDRRTASIESFLTNYTAPNATGDLRFFTNNSNSYTEKMRIEGDGDVGIGATPDASAKLDVSATNKGLLAPRVALTATNAAGPVTAPATSLLIYNTATAGVAPNNVTPGYYYWNGAAWVRFDTGNNIGDWKILGNAGTVAATNFLGTTDNIALTFRTNNIERFRVATTNTQLFSMALGTATNPSYSWNADDNTGIFTPVVDVLGFSTNGVEKMRIEADGDVGIGAAPNASAKLDVTATDRGFLAPRVALTATNAAGPITTPATGLLVYNTATAGAAPNNVVPGYYYNSGTTGAPIWARFATGNGTAWTTLGNAGTVAATNFVGTTDDIALTFRTNNIERFRVATTNTQLFSMALGTATNPSYSWNGDANTGIFTSVADVIGFSTNGTERFRIPNAAQVHAMSSGTALLPFYSWDGDANTGIFKPGNDILGFSTNGAERMRIVATGRTAINSAVAAPSGQLEILGNFAAGVGNDGTIATRNTNASGIAIGAAGQNQTWNGLPTGSGGAFVGNTTGLTAFYTTGGVGEAIYAADGFGATWRVGRWDGLAYYKIIGTGAVSTVVEDLNNELVVMSCPETPENLYFDYGIGKLENGRIYIQIDPILTKNIIVDEEHPLKVFIQLEGECFGVYVTNKTAEGFEVIELNGGTSNTQFSYKIVATMGNQTVTSPNGISRTATFDKRWPVAPKAYETITPLIPVD